MIGRLRGTLVEKHPPWLLLEAGGVGYELQAPMTTFYTLPAIGHDVTLFIHLVVREDAHQLFGFIDRPTRELFRELIKVNGVGPKMALAMLSALAADELIDTLQQHRTQTLVKVPGIGQKTAERLMVELRDRIARWPQAGLPAYPAAAAQPPQAQTDTTRSDAESALLALGYKPQEAERAVKAALQEPGSHTTEDLIRLALKGMVTR